MRFTRWDETWSTDASNVVLFSLAGRLLEEIRDASVKAQLSDLLSRGDAAGLCVFELPLCDVDSFRAGRQILALFQKRDDLTIPGVDPKDVARRTFEEAERLCSETNHIFRSYSQGGFYFLPRVESVLYVAQRKISRILGDVPRLEDLNFRFGPGATTQVKKREASARRKLAQAFCCSEDSIPRIREVLEEVPLWSQVSTEDLGVTVPVCIQTARMDFVRKTAKTDRTIAVEPALTGMVQLGIGSFIAAQLKREGVDISDQTLNQRLAREGSLTGALATLDLSSASDTVARGLVESLLPFDWWDFLRSFRSAHLQTPSGEIRLEKFSTMGNGFTFALETLIFYALAKACAEMAEVEGPVSVYGDDIIVPTGAYALLCEVLCATGFLVNKRKSFSAGPFRESCGKDYYSGISVRPCYIKAALSGATLFILHNYFVREGRPDLSSFVRQWIDDSLAIYGPDGFGDGHLLGDVYHLEPLNRTRGWGGYTFETYTYKPNRVFYRGPLSADYVFPAYSIYVSSDADVNEVPSGVFRRLPRGIGVIRPAGRLSTYRAGSLEDTLPGVQGYKRIKIYTLNLP